LVEGGSQDIQLDDSLFVFQKRSRVVEELATGWICNGIADLGNKKIVQNVLG
jgi:hypothetical protein